MWVLAKLKRKPQWLFNGLWTNETHFALHWDVNTQNIRIWITSNHRENQTKPLFTPHSRHVVVGCSFIASFIVGPFFEERLPSI